MPQHPVARSEAPAVLGRWLVRVGAILAGAALVAAFPAPAAWWWAYVGLVPVLLLVRSARDRREAVWRSWLAASGFFLALHHWVLPYLSVFTVPLAALFGLIWLPWGLVAWGLLRRPPTPRRTAVSLVLLPAVWVVVEFLRSWDRLGGSWGFLGLTQWNAPTDLLSIAAVGGVWALSVLLVAVNVGVAVALMPGAPRRSRALGVGVAAALVLASVIHGAARPEPPVEGTLHLGGVQPGHIPNPRERLDENVRLTRELVQREPDVDVVVWGQSSVGFDPARAEDVRQRLLGLAAEIDRQLVVNVDARRPDGRVSKTAIVVEPDGFRDTYRKQRLVPFGEYIPLRSLFGWVEHLTDAAGEDRVPGTSLTTFVLAGDRVGPLISYESTFPDMRRTLARMDVSMTLVQAAATSFQGSWALPQQGSFEAVRAVESGRPAVLVAVSGTSSAFDPRGERLAWVPQEERTAWSVEVPLSREETLFVRWGPWVPLGAAAVTAVAAAAALGHVVRRGHSSPTWSLARSRSSRDGSALLHRADLHSRA